MGNSGWYLLSISDDDGMDNKGIVPLCSHVHLHPFIEKADNWVYNAFYVWCELHEYWITTDESVFESLKSRPVGFYLSQLPFKGLPERNRNLMLGLVQIESLTQADIYQYSKIKSSFLRKYTVLVLWDIRMRKRGEYSLLFGTNYGHIKVLDYLLIPISQCPM